MAVQIFKDGKSIYVEPKRLQGHLKIGWSVDDPEAEPMIHNLAVVHPHKHIGMVEVSPEADDEEAERAVLEQMGIVSRETPSIDNVVIGATNIPV